MKTLIVLIALALTGCATTITERAQGVRYLKNSDAPAHCKELGKIHIATITHFTEQSRENALREKASDMGGDVVVLDSRDENNNLYGTAFKCGRG